MVKIVNGNLLDATEDIICHQVNCQGVMGSGVAKAIRDKWPEVFISYNQCCHRYKEAGESPMGTIWGCSHFGYQPMGHQYVRSESIWL